MSDPLNQLEAPIEGTSRRTVANVMRASVASSGATFLFSLVLVPFILDRAGADIYGAWIALVTVLAVAALADGGVRTEVARRVAGANGRGDREALCVAANEGTTAIGMVAVPVTAVLVLVAPLIEHVILPHGLTSYSADQLVLLLRCLVVLLCVQLVAGAHLAALRGIQRQDVELVAQAVSLPVNAAFIILGLRADWGIWSLLSGQVAAALTMLAWQWVALRRIVPDLRFRVMVPRMVHLRYLTLSGLALVTQVGDVFDSQWDKLVLSHYVGPAGVASFFVGTSIALQAKVVAAIPLAPLMVAVAERSHPAHPDTRQLQLRLMKLAAVLSGTVLGGVFVFGPAFVRLWLGAGHHDTALAARWFVIAVLINLMIAPAALQAYGEGRQRLAAIGAAANLVSNTVLSLALTIQIGYMGAIYGSIIGNLIGALVFVAVARARLSYWLWPPVGALLVAVFAAAVVMIMGWDSPTSWLTFAGGVAAYALVTLVAGARLEGLRRTDLRATPR